MNERNAQLDFDRRVAAWLASQPAGSADDQALHDIDIATSRMRPLPRWLALTKEPPMRISSHVAVGSPTMRLASTAAIVAAMALALAAAVAGASLLTDPSTGPGRWALYRGNAERRAEGGRGPVGELLLRWRFQAPAGFSRAPTVADGIVYAVSDNDTLHALDEATGSELWQASDVGSHASIVDGLVVVSSPDGRVRALDALTGAEVWTTPSLLSGDVGAGLDADGSSVYVAMAGAIAALDVSTGTERWRHTDPTLGEVHRPALSDGLLYAGTNLGGFVALDAETGVRRWQAGTGIDQTGTAVATDGIAYIGASSGGGPGRLSAFDAATGSALWSIDEQLFSPAVSDGLAFSGSVSGEVTAREASTGEERWRVSLGGSVFPMGVADGVVYAPAGADGRVHALDATTGTELSAFDVEGDLADGLAVANGSVYVGTTSGWVYAIGGDGIAKTPAAPLPEAEDPTVADPDAATATDVSVSPRDSTSSALAAVSTGDLPEGRVIFGRFVAEGGAEWMYALDAESGERMIGQPDECGSCATVSSDGERLATLSPDAEGRFSVVVMDSDGSARMELDLPSGFDGFISGPFDGPTVYLYGWDEDAPERDGIYRASSTDFSDLSQVTTAQADGFAYAIVAAPDGSRLLVFRPKSDNGEHGDLLIVDRDGANMHRLNPEGTLVPRLPSTGDAASFSPDSTQVAFAAYRGPEGSLDDGAVFVADADDAASAEPITPWGDGTGAARWSPSGDLIAFERRDDVGHSALYLVDPAGDVERRLSEASAEGVWAQAPVWSPSGQWLVFQRGDHSGNDLWVIKPDGTDLRQLTSHPAGYGGVRWAP